MVKPNQKITPALLVPVPVIGEPFEQVILDCVSPLPKTKSGNQFLLIMCSANQFPEAISIRKNDFCYYKMADQIISTFGLPKILQTDQGTDFLSKLFKQVIKLGGQWVSSVYHPESLSSSRDWDEGFLLVLYGICETVQESLAFSSADLVFGHSSVWPTQDFKRGNVQWEVEGNYILLADSEKGYILPVSSRRGHWPKLRKAWKMLR